MLTSSSPFYKQHHTTTGSKDMPTKGKDEDRGDASVELQRPNHRSSSEEISISLALHEDDQGDILDGSFISFVSRSSNRDDEEVGDQDEVKSDVSPIDKEEELLDDIQSLSSTRIESCCSTEEGDGSLAGMEGSFDSDANSGVISSSKSFSTDETMDVPPPNSLNQYSPFAFTKRLVACQHRHNSRSARNFHGTAQQLFVTQRRQQRQQQSIPPSASDTTTTESNNNNNSSNGANCATSAEPVVVLGVDITHLSATYQFLVCAAGVFSFNLSFGFLQEFVAVEICNRNLGLFLAMMQFTGYTILSYILRTFVNPTRESTKAAAQDNNNSKQQQIHSYPAVPTYMYLGLGGLSAVDMAMTNMAMHYINYPAKTLMKSSRVVFTMIFGVLLAGKRYRLVDYLIVLFMVGGLAIFLNADASSSAIFEPMGVFMLTISLICDGATNIMSETIMKNYGVGQDELIFRMYSLALMAVTATATLKGDLRVGLMWMLRPGTYDEWKAGASEDEITWNTLGKITMIVLFSSMGFFGSSCSAAITKNFGALTMSMTSTARRATTLFISFFMFDNECTMEHVAGVVVFITAMTTKSLMARSKGGKTKVPLSPPPTQPLKDLERGRSFSATDIVAADSATSERSLKLVETQELIPRSTDYSRSTWSCR